MYSMVMMMALSGSAATPADHGCAGCAGAACQGYACNGGGHRLFGHGCHGGLFGHGCNGGCHGGFLGHRGHGCQGACNGAACNGGCHGGGHRLFGHGCKGGCNGGCHGGFLFGHRGHGCHGGYACNGGCAGAGCAGGAATPAAEEIKTKPKMDKPEGGVKKPTVFAPDQALLIVSLPADANLSIDDQATSAGSETRTFVTPSGLETGKDYYYTLKAEMTRDGQPVAITRVVTVKAGEETRVSIELPVAITAAR